MGRGSGLRSPLKDEVNDHQMNDGEERNENIELRLSGLVVEDQHAKDRAERAEASGESEKIPFRYTESILLCFFLIRMKERECNQVHQNEERKKRNIIFIYEFKYSLHAIINP